ncbi:hypothetical protein [Streptomyces profundus]|uniref:hypothetical protein n=1 Tax=Streptomyces profundus TaxID=2867410 RepID=UPI001D16F297|nr:hypothetical protein [Streptomyces sp. MA3_2.13]UED87351.1 hypothetical protein K4G22_26655 [Streptomyces sp. MA3_2.13]
MTMKVFAWLLAAIGVALSIPYVLTGLAGDDGLAWLNGWLVGPALLIFFVPHLFTVGRMLEGATGVKVSKKFRDAPIGMGTVVSMERTGLTVNDQPQMDILLDVDTLDGQSFRGVARQLVDLTELALVVPGTVVPVRYLPGSTDGKVALATDAPPDEMQAAINRVRVAKGEMTPKQLRIAEAGYLTRAVVLEMRPTGEVEGNRSVLVYTLRVSRPDGSSFDIEQSKAVPPSAIPQLQPGMVVKAQYLPHDESEVVVAIRANA